MNEILLCALRSLPDRKGTISEVLRALGTTDAVLAGSLIYHDLVVWARDARSRNEITITYDRARTCDVLTAVN